LRFARALAQQRRDEARRSARIVEP